VFNRRFPKCERCSIEPGKNLVMSADERNALMSNEREEADAHRRAKMAAERKRKANNTDAGDVDGGFISDLT
jgi:hypothetical protein